MVVRVVVGVGVVEVGEAGVGAGEERVGGVLGGGSWEA